MSSPLPGSSPWAYAYWGDPDNPRFRSDNIVSLSFCGAIVSVNRRAVLVFQELERVFQTHPYGRTIDAFRDDWGYANRCIRGTGPGTGSPCRKSNHAWGIALDVNATRNVRGTRGDIPIEIVQVVERAGIVRWGGRFSRRDPMHFEVVLTPAEIELRYVVPRPGGKKMRYPYLGIVLGPDGNSDWLAMPEGVSSDDIIGINTRGSRPAPTHTRYPSDDRRWALTGGDPGASVDVWLIVEQMEVGP